MPFSLRPAEPSDVPTMASITYDTSQVDPHTQLKTDYGAYDHGATMTAALEMWLTRPLTRCRPMKAVDDESGEILGWAVWGYRGYDDNPQYQNTVAAANNDNHDAIVNSNTGIARLKRLTDKDLQDWMAKLMPEGTKCMFIHSIVVKPAHQGRGVGTALLQYGTSQADRDGVFCWVHSSEAGYDRFVKGGFKEISRLDLDLDEFAAEERQKRAANEVARPEEDVSVPENKRYGTYTLRIMKRLPVPASS